MKILVHWRLSVICLHVYLICHSFLCLFSVAALLNLSQNEVQLVYGRKSQEKWTLQKGGICSGEALGRGDQKVQR